MVNKSFIILFKIIIIIYNKIFIKIDNLTYFNNLKKYNKI